MMNRIRILILTVFILIVSCIGATVVFAGTGNTATASVYVTISNDSDFVQGADGTVMANVSFTVEYFDLADYGLEEYYRKDENGNVIEQPTVLHLLIRVLERYYAMRRLTRTGDMHSNIIDISEGAGSLWLNRFWGHDGNLMYFVNHMYPLMRAKWGATADYILLYDGDEVDLAMYTDYSFYNNSAFMYFDQNTVSAKTGIPLELQLLAKPTAIVNDGVDRDSIPMQNETIRVSSDRGITWSQLTEKTDADGMISLTFDSAGTYYVATGPSHIHYTDAAPAICVVTVRDITPEEQALIDAKQTAISDLQSYTSPDLYREVEQASLASIVQSGTASINAATTVSAVQTAYSNATSQIDALKTRAEYEAEEQELVNAKQTAIANLQNYRSPDLYREAEQASLSSIIQSGTAAINAVTDIASVNSAYNNAISQIDALKTIAQYEAEEQGQGGEDDPEALARAKADAKTELSEYLASKDLTQYRDEQKTELIQTAEQGNAAIEAAKTVDEVTAALADAKAALDAVKTDTQMAEEEKALVKAKKDALADLYLYKVPADYREVEAAMLSSILAEGEASINAAKTKEEVEALLAVYKARIDELKTDAEYTREEEEARKEQEKQKRKAKETAIKKAKAAKTTVKVKALKKHRAKVTWKKVSGVTGYKVYRSTRKSGKYKLVKTVKKAKTLKYINKKLKKGKKYFYKVRTYTRIDGKNYLGKWSKVKWIRAK